MARKELSYLLVGALIGTFLGAFVGGPLQGAVNGFVLGGSTYELTNINNTKRTSDKIKPVWRGIGSLLVFLLLGYLGCNSILQGSAPQRYGPDVSIYADPLNFWFSVLFLFNLAIFALVIAVKHFLSGGQSE